MCAKTRENDNAYNARKRALAYNAQNVKTQRTHSKSNVSGTTVHDTKKLSKCNSFSVAHGQGGVVVLPSEKKSDGCSDKLSPSLRLGTGT